MVWFLYRNLKLIQDKISSQHVAEEPFQLQLSQKFWSIFSPIRSFASYEDPLRITQNHMIDDIELECAYLLRGIILINFSS